MHCSFLVLEVKIINKLYALNTRNFTATECRRISCAVPAARMEEMKIFGTQNFSKIS
jgi:hypothetical protein